MRLKLTRPVIFFDLETTGTNILRDRIVEISVIKVFPAEENKPNTVYSRRVNPEMPIPKEASDIHGILDADVANEPTFREIAHKMAEFFSGCDLAGFNSNKFDIPMLCEEFTRAGVDFDLRKVKFIDVQTIFHKREPRNLEAAYRYYCNRELTDAHSAEADIRATYEVLKAQLDRYADLPDTVEELAKYTSYNNNVDLAGRLIYDDEHREVINFGKYKGQLAEKVLEENPGYNRWIQDGDFSTDTKKAFQSVMTRIDLRRRKGGQQQEPTLGL